MDNQITLGLPKGSLNDMNRGNTFQLLRDAGYEIIGYEPKNEQPSKLEISNDGEIKLVLVRPQSAPKELWDGVLDIAIFGKDWAYEWALAGYPAELMAGLSYGKAEISVASQKPVECIKGSKGGVVCYSEYVNIASKFVNELTGSLPTLQIRGRTIRGSPGTLASVCFSDGLTEAYVQKGLADLVIECVQSGNTLKDYGLEKQLCLLETEAGLYINPMLKSWKREKAESVKEMLLGAVRARNYDLVVLNAGRCTTPRILEYISEERLFSEEPTINYGDEWNEITLMAPKKAYPVVAARLRQLGAASIIRLEPKQVI